MVSHTVAGALMKREREAFDWEANRHLVCDSTGRKLTVGLFEELADPACSIKPPFKLADWRKTYVELADPSDYKAAQVLIGNWDHWTALLGCKSFLAELVKWREEVLVKLRSDALASLVKQSRSDKGTAAAKYLAELGGTGAKRGRPAKHKEDDDLHPRSSVGADAARLGLIKGGKA